MGRVSQIPSVAQDDDGRPTIHKLCVPPQEID